MTDTTDNAPFYLNPTGVLSAGQSELRPEGGLIRAYENTPPGTRELPGKLQTEQDAMEAEHKQYLKERGQKAAALQEEYRHRPAIPNQQQLGPPPDARDYQKHSGAWLGAMAMIGALAAKSGRVSGTAALSAFSGAMKGWQEGNLEAYNNAAEKWKNENARTIENNRQLLERYQMVLDDHRMNIDEKLAEYKRVAIENHDDQGYHLANMQHFTAIAQRQDMLDEWLHGPKGLERTSAILAARHDANVTAQQELAMKLGPDAEAIRNRNMRDPTTGQPWTNAQYAQADYLLQNFAPQGTSGTLTPLSLQEMVDRRLSGDKSVLANIGRGTQGAQNIAAFNNALSAEMQRRNMTGADLTKIDQAYIARQRGASAEEGAVGQRAGAIALVVDEANRTVPNVRRLAELSAGRGYATWDALESRWKAQKGDKNFAEYVQQLNSLVNIYGRVISGGGKGAVTDREHARDMLNPNMPLTAIQGSLDGYEYELGVAAEAPARVRARMRGEGDKPAGAGRDNLPSAATPTNGGPTRINSKEEYDALPPGTVYIPPDGSEPRTKS